MIFLHMSDIFNNNKQKKKKLSEFNTRGYNDFDFLSNTVTLLESHG